MGNFDQSTDTDAHAKLRGFSWKKKQCTHVKLLFQLQPLLSTYYCTQNYETVKITTGDRPETATYWSGEWLREFRRSWLSIAKLEQRQTSNSQNNSKRHFVTPMCISIIFQHVLLSSSELRSCATGSIVVRRPAPPGLLFCDAVVYVSRSSACSHINCLWAVQLPA